MNRREPTERTTQRVILRHPFVIDLPDQRGLVLEIGSGGLKVEHRTRLTVGAVMKVDVGAVTLPCVVRYSVILPGETGVLYHSGLEFSALTPELSSAVYDMLLREAEEQVREWEANLDGVEPRRLDIPVNSGVIHHYVWLRFVGRHWTRVETADPNQPLDGIAVPDDVSEEETALLCATYERGDEATRQYLRTCATLAIIERLRNANETVSR